MKKHITTAQELLHWIDLLDVIRKELPNHAKYFEKNLLIDGKKDKLVYTGSLEAVANMLDWALIERHKTKPRRLKS